MSSCSVEDMSSCSVAETTSLYVEDPSSIASVPDSADWLGDRSVTLLIQRQTVLTRWVGDRPSAAVEDRRIVSVADIFSWMNGKQNACSL